MKTKKKRIGALMLSICMLFSMMSGFGMTALAAENDHTGLCEHHPEHTKECGYQEAVSGKPCLHEHTEECYQETTVCLHEHTEECYPEEVSDGTANPDGTEGTGDNRKPTACTHVCSVENGCITRQLVCHHEHDSECGYAPAVEGAPCSYECEVCDPKVISDEEIEDAEPDENDEIATFAAGGTVYVNSTDTAYGTNGAGDSAGNPCSLSSGWNQVKAVGGTLMIVDTIDIPYSDGYTNPRCPLILSGANERNITIEGYGRTGKLTSSNLSNGMIAMGSSSGVYNGTLTVRNLTLEFTGKEGSNNGFINTWSGTYSPTIILNNVTCTATGGVTTDLSIYKSVNTQITNLTLNNVNASLGSNVTLNTPIIASGTTSITSNAGVTRANTFVSGPMLKVTGGNVTLKTTLNGNSVKQPICQAVDGGTLTLDNGAILQNGGIGVIAGSGVAQPSVGHLVMNNGSTITGCTGYEYQAGGVVIQDSCMTGAGGVSVAGPNSTMVMNGGTITNNTTNTFAGAIICAVKGTCTMNGGTITQNKSTKAGSVGGIMVDELGYLILSGGTITGNSGIGAGGVGWWDNTGTATIKGTNVPLVIKDNTVNNAPVNFQFQSADLIADLSNTTLPKGSSIGITPKAWPTASADVKIVKNVKDASAAQYFFSDQATTAGILYCDGTKDMIGTATVNGNHTHNERDGKTLWLSNAALPRKVTVTGIGIVAVPTGTTTLYGSGDFQITAADGYYFPNALTASVAPVNSAVTKFTSIAQEKQEKATLSVTQITKDITVTVNGAAKYLGKIGNTYYGESQSTAFIDAMKKAASGKEIILGDNMTIAGLQMNAGVKMKKYSDNAFTTIAPNTLYNIASGTITANPAEAKSGNTLYASLGDAVKAAKSGETVELLQNPKNVFNGAFPQGVALKNGTAVYTAKATDTNITVDKNKNITLNSGTLGCANTNNVPVNVKMPGNSFLPVSGTGSFDVTVPKTGAPYVTVPQAGQGIDIDGVIFQSDTADSKMPLPNPLAVENAESGNITAQLPSGKSVTTKGGETVTAPQGNKGTLAVTNQGVTVGKANDAVTIGDTEYTAKANDTVIDYNDGAPVLSKGAVELDKDEPILVGETPITNTGDTAIIVTVGEPAKISIPSGGKAVIDGVEYTNDGNNDLELPVRSGALDFIKTYLTDKDGKVYNEITVENCTQILSGKEAFDKLNQADRDAINVLLANDDADAYNAYADYLTAADAKATDAAEAWKEAHKDILDKDKDSVTDTDMEAIDKALEEYANLVSAVKDKLSAEKAKLEEMKVAADDKATDTADGWKEEHKDILAKDEDSVTDADMGAIDKALEEYEKLSPAAKEKLSAEKEKLDAMKDVADKEATKASNTWKEDHKAILAKDVESVTDADMEAIDKALEEYAKLSPAAKEKLSAEKAKLDEMKVAAEQKAVDAADAWKADNNEILGKDVDSVTDADMEAIDKALEEYAKLSPTAQEKLSAEKEKLDAMKAAADQKATDVSDTWKEDNKVILEKDVDSVTDADMGAIDKALEEYEKLTLVAQEKLSEEKAKLDEMKVVADQKAIDVSDTWKEDNKAILEKDVDSVTDTDMEAIDKALEEYAKLSPTAKEKLSAEKAKLDEMKVAAEQKAVDAADAWKADNNEILGKDVDSVTDADMEAIDKALEEYAKLSPTAQEKLSAEKEKLDAMKAAADQKATDVSDTWKEDNKVILEKDVDSVTDADMGAIDKALEEYEKLTLAAQEKLSEEKAKLDEMKVVADQKAIDVSDTWKEDNKAILEKDVDSVTDTDMGAIDKALEEYAKLSPAVQEKLSAEKAKLDEMKVAADQKAVDAADAWKEDNKTILDKDVDSVRSADMEAVNKALEEYAKLSPAAQEKLSEEKAKLDQMKANDKKATDASNAWKEDNKAILGKDAASVTDADMGAIDKALEEYAKLSPAAQEKVSEEKAKLEELKKAADKKATDVSNTWKEDHKAILAKDVASVTDADMGAIDKALEEYAKLSPAVQEKLSAEKAKLDEMKAVADKKATDMSNTWKKDNKAILDKDVASVTDADMGAIDKALEEYAKLSPAAQEKLSAEKAKLEEMKVAADQKAVDAADAWKEDNKTILDKDVDSVRSADMEAVNKALEEYAKLSPAAQEKLSEEKAKLDQMKANDKKATDASNAWKEDNKAILGKDAASVTDADMGAIDKALEEYEKLSPAAKEKVSEEKAKLEELKKAADKKATDVSNTWKEDHKAILAKDVASVTDADMGAIDKALEEYAKLSPAAQEKLSAEKAKLDEMKAVADKKATDMSNTWKKDNKAILDKDVASVTDADMGAIDKALEEYAKLSPAAQDKLSAEKAKLDEMKKAADQKATDASNTWKEDHKAILGKDVDSVRSADMEAVDKALEEYAKLSPAAQEKLSEEKAKLDQMKTNDKKATNVANTWKEDHKAILAKDVASVTDADMEAIDKALEEYAKLSPAAQDKLSAEKEKLDAMKDFVDKKATDVSNTWKDNHKDILAKDVASVTDADMEAIDKALEEYAKLSPAAQEKVSEEKAKLDEMKKAADEKAMDAAHTWKEENKAILAKDADSVRGADMEAVNKALEEYAKLSPAAQEKLSEEKAKLDQMKANDRKATDAAHTWKEENKVILAKDVASVTDADMEAIDKALGEYAKLTPAAQEKLSAEKAKLDEMKAVADKKAADAAAKWKEDHKNILSQNANSVNKSDLDAINKALEDYKKLSPAAKAKLSAEKTKLDVMKDACTPQTGDNANLWLWVTLMLVACGAIGMTAYGRRKEEQAE